MRKVFPAVLLALFVLGLAGVASAADKPAGDPKANVDRAYAVIKQSVDAATTRDKLVEDITGHFDALVDYDAFSKKTLRATWDEITPEQQAKFKALFRRLVIKNYAKRFKPKAQFTVSYRGDTVFADDGAKAEVKTTVAGEKAAADVDYLFEPVKVGGKLEWRAGDIVVDGVSMAINWRGQFSKIVKKSGFDALLERIEKQVNKPDAE